MVVVVGVVVGLEFDGWVVVQYYVDGRCVVFGVVGGDGFLECFWGVYCFFGFEFVDQVCGVDEGVVCDGDVGLLQDLLGYWCVVRCL